MHSKQKGNIGELAVAKELSKLGLPVFREIGDLSKVDLITLVGNTPVRIQVKAAYCKDGKLILDFNKSGPNYSFKYKSTDVDVFALYALDLDVVIYVPSSIVNSQSTMTFRVTESKNKRFSKVHDYKDYLSFWRVLRDYTPCPLVIKGDDIVQTTIPETVVSES